ncbi:MAG: phage terminase large subunit [Oceanicoccus sp.]
MPDLQLLAQELELRINARRDIYSFIKYMSTTGLLDVQHEPQKHHRVIVDAIHAMLNGGCPKLIAALPPGSAKSTYLSIILPCFLLAQDPTIQILCLSAAESLAENFARRRRTLMKTKEWQRIAQTELAPDSQSLAFQGTQKGGTIVAAGCGSTISGLRCDWLVVDDPISGMEQANSLSQTDKLATWYFSEARTRIKPGGKEIILATRWSSLDLSQRLLDLHFAGKEEWRYIRIPMEADATNDPLGRELGERLWPEWYTQAMVEDAKRDPMIWTTLYQQTPIADTGSWVPSENIHIRQLEDLPPKQKMKIYISADIALSVQRGDWTVFAVVGLDTQKNLIVLEVYRQQVSPDVSAKVFIELCRKYSPVQAFIDDDNASKVWRRLIYEVSMRSGVPAPLQLVKTGNRDKETRAAPLRSYFLQDRVQIAQAPWNTELLDELAKFPHSRHDDQIDALALPAKELIKLAGPSKKKAPMPTQQFLDSTDGQIYLSENFDSLFDTSTERNKRNTLSKSRI